MSLASMCSGAFGLLAAAAGESISYRRSGQSTLTITAVVGRTEFTIDNGDGPQTELDSRDFIINAADLGDLTLPKRGDRIDRENEQTFEVLPAYGERCYRVCDPGPDTTLRIHAKRVK